MGEKTGFLVCIKGTDTIICCRKILLYDKIIVKYYENYQEGYWMNNIKELNVLVLSMSTLPWNGLSSSKYYGMYNNKKISGNYVGQLEAGTKFLIRVLKENNKKFDKIVILNTGKTIEEERESESKPFSKYINVEDRDTDLFSADSFFKKRINKYLKTYEEL